MKKIIIGNWKMNPATYEEAKEIAAKTRAVASKLKKVDVVACPPFPFIDALITREDNSSLALGAQSVSEFESGSHTGQVSAKMLKSLGVEYVIVGHSEEREYGDTNARIAKRIQSVLDVGLTAVVCVGEKVRDEHGAYMDFIRTQMKETFAGVPIDKARKIIVAYEPVWAIGAKEAMKSEQIYEMALFVKKVFSDTFGAEVALKLKVLYGGSVNAKNAGEIMTVGKVDGLLVGRESVSITGFPDLLKVVEEVS